MGQLPEPQARRTLLLAVAASTALNGVALAMGRGSFLHWVVVGAIAVYGGGAALVLGAAAYAMRNRLQVARRAARVATLSAAVLGSMTISLWPGSVLASRDIDDAKEYCTALISQIELEKRTGGAYPTNLSRYRRDGDGPHLVRRSLHYQSDGATYTLTFSDPRGLMNFVSFNSSVGQWSEWH